jgi:hypothetical protein
MFIMYTTAAIGGIWAVEHSSFSQRFRKGNSRFQNTATIGIAIAIAITTAAWVRVWVVDGHDHSFDLGHRCAM